MASSPTPTTEIELAESRRAYELGKLPSHDFNLQEKNKDVFERSSLEENRIESGRPHHRHTNTNASSENDQTYYPIGVPEGYPSLDFRPLLLRNWVLVFEFIFFLTSLAALITLLILSRIAPGRLHTRVSSKTVIIEYVPTIVGSITTILWRSLSRSYFRLMPYVTMASVPTDAGKIIKDRVSGGNDAVSSLAQYDYHPLAFWALIRGRHYMTLLIHVTTILVTLFVAPLKTGLLQVTQDDAGWIIDISGGISAILIFLYSLIVVCCVGMFCRLLNQPTGLKWEPASLASQFTLLNNLNYRQAFAGTEFLTAYQAQIKARTWGPMYGVLRLGYWQQGKNGPIVHGIRFLQGGESSNGRKPRDFTQISAESSSNVVHLYHRPNRGCNQSTYAESEEPQDSQCRVVCSPEYSRYRFANEQTSDLALVILFIPAIICIIISIIRMSDGTIYTPIRSDLTLSRIAYVGRIDRSSHISAGNNYEPLGLRSIGEFLHRSDNEDINSFMAMFILGLVFSFLPALLFMFFSTAFFAADIRYRTCQALQGLSEPRLAEENLLLDYVSPNPVTVIFKAISNRHFYVAWHAFLALTSTFSVIVAGRIFNILREPNGQIRMIIVPANFHAAFAILCIYIISLPFVRPPANYRTPRLDWMSILDTASFVYDSPVLDSEEFNVQDSTDEEKHLRAKVLLAKQKYCFGMYLGRDGRRHMGIGSVMTNGEQKREEHVVDRFRVRWVSDFCCFRMYRRPEIVPADE